MSRCGEQDLWSAENGGVLRAKLHNGQSVKAFLNLEVEMLYLETPDNRGFDFSLLKEYKRYMKEDTEITLETLVQMVARGFESVHEELGEIKTDVAVLKEDVAVLKDDVSELKEDVAVLKEDVIELRVMTKRIDERTQNQMDAVYHDTHTLTERVEVLEKR